MEPALKILLKYLPQEMTIIHFKSNVVPTDVKMPDMIAKI